MSANLENSTMTTGLEKISFHSNPKEKECQRMFTLPHNHTFFMCQQDYAQNPSGQASAVHEPRTSRCKVWVQKRQRNQRSNCQHFLDHRESFIEYSKAFYCVDHNKLWEILKEMGIPDYPTRLLRKLYASQEVTVRTGPGKTDQFQTGK